MDGVEDTGAVGLLLAEDVAVAEDVVVDVGDVLELHAQRPARIPPSSING
jgi:hypothetical protein